MKSKKLLSLLLTGAIIIGTASNLAGCAKYERSEEDATTTTITNPETTEPATTKLSKTEEEFIMNAKMPTLNPLIKNDTENKVGYQLEMPKSGDQIAILHTNMGDITLRLFPENAPKTVTNFITLAQQGKYDGVIFHRVINDFMIQTGDYENANGTGGKSIYGDKFEDEFASTLFNIRGSVAMANSGVNTNGSQFFINQSNASSFNRNNHNTTANITEDKIAEIYESIVYNYNQYAAYYGTTFTSRYPTLESYADASFGQLAPLTYAVDEEVWKLYEENGGNIHLDGALRVSGGHTVFAQVIEGMDIVDAIAAVETDDNDKPKTDVIINTVEITTY